MDGFILSIDQGTSATKAFIFDRAGAIVSGSSREIVHHYPQEGWVEEDPQEIWQKTLQAVGEALQNARILPEDLRALGIANQQCTTVVWSRRTGEAIGRAIVWQDRRTQGICERFSLREVEAIARRNGGGVFPNLSCTKLRWLLENDRAVQKALAQDDLLFGTMDSWLIWKLTEGRVHRTDPSNASSTGMLNMETGTWDSLVLEKFGIPPEILPAIGGSSEVCGATAPGAFFGQAVPISGCAGDQLAAAFGQACLEPGMMKNTYGTGSFMIRTTGERHYLPEKGVATPVLWSLGGRLTYCLEGFSDVSGEVIHWLGSNLGFIKEASEADSLAIQVQDSGGVYFVPTMVGMQTPLKRPKARGTIFGLNFHSTKQHITRAALESIAYQTRDTLDNMEAAYGFRAEGLRVDGGGAMSDFLMQFQADILGIPVERPRVTEASALGAAYLAGLAVGYWEGLQAVRDNWSLDTRFEPRISEARREDLHAGWLEALDLAGGWRANLGAKPRPRGPDPRLEALSPREAEVMKLFASGLTMNEIASLLQTNLKTVEKQRRDAMQKLGVDNLAKAVRVCLDLGLVRPD